MSAKKTNFLFKTFHTSSLVSSSNKSWKRKKTLLISFSIQETTYLFSPAILKKHYTTPDLWCSESNSTILLKCHKLVLEDSPDNFDLIFSKYNGIKNTLQIYCKDARSQVFVLLNKLSSIKHEKVSMLFKDLINGKDFPLPLNDDCYFVITMTIS